MSPFRNWAHNRWLDNCEERVLYRDGDRLSEREYFQRFKWWLRREYRHQNKKELERENSNEQFKR
jgi:hypothetical protein